MNRTEEERLLNDVGDMKDSLARLEERESLRGCKDHESRLRALEKSEWKRQGIVATAAAILSLFGAKLFGLFK